MRSHEDLIEFHAEARSIKEHHWYQHKEPDMYPLLVLRWRDMPAQSVDVAAVGGALERLQKWAIRNDKEVWLTQTEMSTPLVLFTTLAALKDRVSLPGIQQMPALGVPVESIHYAVEGYSIEGDEADVATIMRGDLKRDYETNPNSKVFERLTTYMVETASTGLAEWARITSAFHKDDGGRIVWHEPIVNTSEDTFFPKDGHDALLEIMIPHVTREKLA